MKRISKHQVAFGSAIIAALFATAANASDAPVKAEDYKVDDKCTFFQKVKNEAGEITQIKEFGFRRNPGYFKVFNVVAGIVDTKNPVDATVLSAVPVGTDQATIIRLRGTDNDLNERYVPDRCEMSYKRKQSIYNARLDNKDGKAPVNRVELSQRIVINGQEVIWTMPVPSAVPATPAVK